MLKYSLYIIFLVSLTFSQASASSESIDSGDTAWIIVATVLVMIMTPSLGYFYSGMVRSSNAVATIMHSFMKLCIVSIVWVLCGYSLAFGPSINGFIGGLDMVFF
jgi:Amt family ammonium transporter